MPEEYSEREIRRTLRRIAKQRVVMTFEDDEMWVVENVLTGEDTRAGAILRTCYIRGWVEIEGHTVPIEALVREGEDWHLPRDLSNLPRNYRLTQAGWSAIQRTHSWVIATCFVAAAGLVATIVSMASRWC